MSQDNRQKRSRIAQETLDILSRGSYNLPDQQSVSLQPALQDAIQRTELFSPEVLDDLLSEARTLLETQHGPLATIEVTGETTLAAASRLLQQGHTDVMCLNFASAKNPGGGFLGGSQAQEESLARASGLYACIAPVHGYYATHRHLKSLLYTDNMIYSPDVPVFRDDNDQLLEVPYRATMITSAAVNRGAIEQNSPEEKPRIAAVMSERIEKMLALCVHKKQQALVLGAWGCGVFRNDPLQMAEWFRQHLLEHGYARAFKHITFAVYDTSKQQNTRNAFQQTFAPA